MLTNQRSCVCRCRLHRGPWWHLQAANPAAGDPALAFDCICPAGPPGVQIAETTLDVGTATKIGTCSYPAFSSELICDADYDLFPDALCKAPNPDAANPALAFDWICPAGPPGVQIAETLLDLGTATKIGTCSYPAPLCDGSLITFSMDLNGGNGTGTAGRDVIMGTSGPDVIDGLGGDDVICGMGADDTISGGSGDDTILGGTGVDFITGGDGSDEMSGGAGNDRIRGNDTIEGGNSLDTINGGSGNDDLSGGKGQRHPHRWHRQRCLHRQPRS